MSDLNWKSKSIKLSDLYLWDENARFSDKYFNKSEEELIKYFCSEKDFKIEELAKEIVKDFDLPQLEKLIVFDSEDKLIVIEWNRRLSIYKLLNNPHLSHNEKLKDFFINLKKQITIDDSFTLECLVTKNKSEGFRYIERKHINWNNEVAWNEQQRTNYNVRRGNASKKEEFKVAIAKIIKILDIPENFKDQILWPWYVTNFWRILDNSIAWKEFWFTWKSNWDLEVRDKDFKEKLKIIIYNILNKTDFSGNKIDSRSLNTNKDKEKYLQSIQVEDSNKVDNEIKKNEEKNLFWEKIAIPKSKQNFKSKIKINPKSVMRSYLIPKTCRLNINENKINNIYHELRDNLVIDDTDKSTPNAVWVLFRVFLETSIDYFWEKKKWETFADSTNLASKIIKVTDYMESEKIANKNQLKNINKVSSDKTSLLWIQNFHSYVHSYKTQPWSNDLKLKWDNLEEFFEILWNNL